MLLVNRIIDIEKLIPDWDELTDTQLLLALGETLNEENLLNVRAARKQL